MYSVYNKQAHRRHGGHGGRVMGGRPYHKPTQQASYNLNTTLADPGPNLYF